MRNGRRNGKRGASSKRPMRLEEKLKRLAERPSGSGVKCRRNWIASEERWKNSAEKSKEYNEITNTSL
jgi:hypothetical protein